jgi:hypothetical protein
MIQKTAITLLAALTCTTRAAAPLESATPEQSNPPLPSDQAGPLPKNAFGTTTDTGSPYARLFRNTSNPFRKETSDLKLAPQVRPAETVRLRASIDLPDFRGRFPLLQRGFAPEDADLKIGPLYFKLRQLSAGVFWTDNVNHNNKNRESDTSGIVSLGGQVIWQITEGTRLAASGNFVWLPFDNVAGINGFGIRSPLTFGLASSPDARVQASWEPTLFGIPWVFSDEFRTSVGRYSYGVYDSFELFEGFQVDRTGQDSNFVNFRKKRDRGDRDYKFTSAGGNDEFLFFSNEIAAATQAKVRGDFNFRFRAAHDNYWFPDDERGLPSERNTVFAGLDSYRESLRFKPYINYRLSHRPDPDRLYHVARAGVRGPVTDLINFDGNVGHVWDNQRGSSSWLWNAELAHTINPRTRHSVRWSRDLDDLSDEISQHVRYHFSHVLGPGLSTDLYAGYYWVEDTDELEPDREDIRAGLALNWHVSPRTNVRLSGQYSEVSNSDDSFGVQLLRGRFELAHRLYDRVQTRLIYQHTQLDASSGANSYDENQVYFSMSYLFE